MTKRIVLVAGQDREARRAMARAIAQENHWPLLAAEDLSRALTRHVLGDATGNPEDVASLTYKNVVAPAHVDALIATMWSQVEAGVHAVVLDAPFVTQVNDPDWLNELNYDLAVHGYEAVVIYLLAAEEAHPALAPEHYVIGPALEATPGATFLAIELRS